MVFSQGLLKQQSKQVLTWLQEAVMVAPLPFHPIPVTISLCWAPTVFVARLFAIPETVFISDALVTEGKLTYLLVSCAARRFAGTIHPVELLVAFPASVTPVPYHPSTSHFSAYSTATLWWPISPFVPFTMLWSELKKTNLLLNCV